MLWLWETIKSPTRASREDRARLCGTGCDSTPSHRARMVHALGLGLELGLGLGVGLE